MEKTKISGKILLQVYQTMLKIRLTEEKIADLVKEGEIKTPCHLYIGQEAVAAAVCANLKREDFVFSTHRSHGHYLAKGGDLKGLFAEVYCKATGCSGGRGGSMHISSPENGFPGSTAIVAGTIPLAVGAALGFQLKKQKNIAVTFFGDGATNEGIFYEALNFAALKKLPVLFVCENNLYSTHMPVSECLSDTRIYQKAQAFNMPAKRIDGNNAIQVYETSKQFIEDARKGCGPAFIECMTYRWRGHVGPNFDIEKGLRSKEELDGWIDKCAIKRLEKLMFGKKFLNKQKKEVIMQELNKEIEKAVAFAKQSPYPDKKELLKGVFKD